MNQQKAPAGIKLPSYKCQKEVRAMKIKAVDQSSISVEHPGGSWEIVPENSDYAPITVDHEFILRHKPKAGGYFVIYEDGYTSFSPAKAFEDGYRKVEQ